MSKAPGTLHTQAGPLPVEVLSTGSKYSKVRLLTPAVLPRPHPKPYDPGIFYPALSIARVPTWAVSTD